MIDIPEIINGYAQGHFLMSEAEDEPVQWFYTHSRTLIPLDDRFHYPRSLQRVLNQNRFQVKINTAFSDVVDGCANRDTTWISTELKFIYRALNQAGWAYSFETWQTIDDREVLAGGILGIAIQGAFIGESMFFNIPEGSKVAMVKLVEHLRSRGFVLFDAQMMNPHLARFGAYEIKDKNYQKLLQQALSASCSML
jgi:leucyl/phenylalanyl-tRNA---protein transferase